MTFILLIAALTLTAPLQERAPIVQAEAAISQARADLAARRYRRAADRLTTVVAQAPAHGEAWLLLGRAYWSDDRADSLSADQAVEAFSRAVALDPPMATLWGRDALAQLALSAVRSERLEMARAAYRRLLTFEKQTERRAQYESQLEEIALDEGTYKPTAATKFGPTGEITGPIGPLRMRTNRWFEKGRHTQDPVKAEVYYRNAIVADPAMWQSHLNYGIALARQRKFEAALAPLAEADRTWRQANPGGEPHLRAHLWRLTAFLELQRVNDAGAEVAVLTRLKERDPWVQLYVLRYLVAVGRAADALGRIEAMVRDDPENVEVLYARALALRGAGRLSEAVSALRTAMAAVPDNHVTLKYWLEPMRARLREWQGSQTP